MKSRYGLRIPPNMNAADDEENDDDVNLSLKRFEEKTILILYVITLKEYQRKNCFL